MSNNALAEDVAVKDAASEAVCQTVSPALQSVAAKRRGKFTYAKPRAEYIDLFSGCSRAPQNMAKVYAHLLFHAMRNKRGKPGSNPARLEVIREGGRWKKPAYWWLTTYADLAEACSTPECKVTIKRMRTALKSLCKERYVEAHQGRHPVNGAVPKYRNKSVLHVRLGVANRGNGIDSWPDIEQMNQMRIVLECPEGHPIKCPEGHPFLDALEITPDAVTEKQHINFASEELLAEQQVQDQSSKPIQGKTNPTPEALEAWKNFKAEYNKAAHNGENLKEHVSLEWAPDEQKFVQRVEFRAAQRFGSAEGFFAWITPFHWQGTGFKYLGDDPRPNVFHLHAHRDAFFDAYQTYLNVENEKAEMEAYWAAKKAAEQAELDAEREAARQAKLAAAASKARRDARVQRLGYVDFKSLHRELYLRRCKKIDAKYAKPAPALASARPTPPLATGGYASNPAPVQTATAPTPDDDPSWRGNGFPLMLKGAALAAALTGWVKPWKPKSVTVAA